MPSLRREDLDKWVEEWLDANRACEQKGDWKPLADFYTDDATYGWNIGPKEDVMCVGRDEIRDVALGLEMQGLDNWVYCANGDSGGRVRSRKTDKVVNISGRDLRIRPDTGDIDVQTGQTQFGRCCDDWGNWFGNNNSVMGWHYYLPLHYLARNPSLAVKSIQTFMRWRSRARRRA